MLPDDLRAGSLAPIRGERRFADRELGLVLGERSHAGPEDRVVEEVAGEVGVRLRTLALDRREDATDRALLQLDLEALGLQRCATLDGRLGLRIELDCPFGLCELTQDVLGVPVRKVAIPVAAGRNLAVLTEAAVRATVLSLRGIDTTREFVKRQQQAISDAGIMSADND